VLLWTWNEAYYRYHKFEATHLAKIGRLLQDHASTLAKYRHLTIDKLDHAEGPTISRLFQAFENVLGPVGKRCTCLRLGSSLFGTAT
jgi:hypothetical protein